MADVNMACATPGCGQVLTLIPSMCPGCGTFWGSSAQLEQAQRLVVIPVASQGVPPARMACIAVGGNILAIPANTEIVLGRESDWKQIVEIFEAQSEGSAKGVSRKHAAVTVVGDKARIVDLGSTNGTWVGGRDVSGNPVVRSLPTTFMLGLPDVGLAVTIRPLLRAEPVSEWTGVRSV